VLATPTESFASSIERERARRFVQPPLLRLPERIARFISWPLATQVGSSDAPAKMMIGAYWRRQRSTAVSVRGPVAGEREDHARRRIERRDVYVESCACAGLRRASKHVLQYTGRAVRGANGT
jgi:hypothetical protein